MSFQTSVTGFADHAGFAYSPGAEPPYVSEDTYEHISGPWYFWYQSW